MITCSRTLIGAGHLIWRLRHHLFLIFCNAQLQDQTIYFHSLSICSIHYSTKMSKPSGHYNYLVNFVRSQSPQWNSSQRSELLNLLNEVVSVKIIHKDLVISQCPWGRLKIYIAWFWLAAWPVHRSVVQTDISCWLSIQ